MRPSFEEIWLYVAGIISLRSTCKRLQVGAVLVDKHNQIISTGYNGAPRGEPHCIDAGCIMEDGHCVRCVHAEVNALLQAGTRSKHAFLYVTHEPCVRCAAIIKNSGVEFVKFEHVYRSKPNASNLE